MNTHRHHSPDSTNRTNHADAARLAGWLDLAARGWHLIPIRPASKVPSMQRWEQHATTDPARIRRFFTDHPHYNAGIACGPSGLLVVDCDQPKPDQSTGHRGGHGHRDGWAALTWLAEPHGGLPDTWTVTTPSGGRHLYFRAPSGPGLPKLGNTGRTLGPMLDTRGSGGQVLAPGSRFPHGGYALWDDSDPAELPAWLLHRLTTTRPAPDRPAMAGSAGAEGLYRPVGNRQAYVSAVVRAELQRVTQAPPGGHNAAVFTAARALGQLAAAGALDPATAERDLLDAARPIITGPCDCTTRALLASIRSGLTCGARRPRHLPPAPPRPVERRQCA